MKSASVLSFGSIVGPYISVTLPTAVFPQIVVRHGQFEPKDPFVAASYDGDWFWIDNDDLATKRVFSFVMLLLSLSESSRPGQAPLITIPAG